MRGMVVVTVLAMGLLACSSQDGRDGSVGTGAPAVSTTTSPGLTTTTAAPLPTGPPTTVERLSQPLRLLVARCLEAAGGSFDGAVALVTSLAASGDDSMLRAAQAACDEAAVQLSTAVPADDRVVGALAVALADVDDGLDAVAAAFATGRLPPATTLELFTLAGNIGDGIERADRQAGNLGF